MTTDKLDELWDAYNRQGQMIGVQRRGDVMPPATYHLTVAILVFVGSHQLLLQRRGHQKLNHPDTWDVAAGGSALSGETAAQAASRELHEELGLEHAFTTPLTTVWHESWFEAIFAINLPQLKLEQLRLQASEVSAAKIVTLETAAALMSGQSTDWGAIIAQAQTKIG